MADLWTGLSADAQDALIWLALLAPGLVLGAVICRGLALRALLYSLLRRYPWTKLAMSHWSRCRSGWGSG